MSVLNQSGEEQVECPLCMEPLEVDDLNFFPCTCGYQICRFCWHRIRTDENGLCPACRKAYPENPADFKPLSQQEVAKLKAEKRHKDQLRKQKITENRKHLANVRVVQKNLVYVNGLHTKLADVEMLKKHEYFGKFGKIHKVVINQSTSYAGTQGQSATAYVTYHKADDALRAIQAVNNISIHGRTIKASLGTTKYCSHFMKNQTCPKLDCMYLHDLGDVEASFTKEEMQQGKHQEYEKKLHEQLLNSYNKDRKPTPSPPAVALNTINYQSGNNTSTSCVGNNQVHGNQTCHVSQQPLLPDSQSASPSHLSQATIPLQLGQGSSCSSSTGGSVSSLSSSCSNTSLPSALNKDGCNGASSNNSGNNQRRQKDSKQLHKKRHSSTDDSKGKQREKVHSTTLEDHLSKAIHNKINVLNVQNSKIKTTKENLGNNVTQGKTSNSSNKIMEKNDEFSESEVANEMDSVCVASTSGRFHANGGRLANNRAVTLFEPDNNSFFSTSNFTKVSTATTISAGVEWPLQLSGLGLAHMPDVLPVHSSEDWQAAFGFSEAKSNSQQRKISETCATKSAPLHVDMSGTQECENSEMTNNQTSTLSFNNSGSALLLECSPSATKVGQSSVEDIRFNSVENLSIKLNNFSLDKINGMESVVVNGEATGPTGGNSYVLQRLPANGFTDDPNYYLIRNSHDFLNKTNGSEYVRTSVVPPNLVNSVPNMVNGVPPISQSCNKFNSDFQSLQEVPRINQNSTQILNGVVDNYNSVLPLVHQSVNNVLSKRSVSKFKDSDCLAVNSDVSSKTKSVDENDSSLDNRYSNYAKFERQKSGENSSDSFLEVDRDSESGEQCNEEICVEESRQVIDDELDFDPFHETQKALAEMIEKESLMSSVHGQSSLGIQHRLHMQHLLQQKQHYHNLSNGNANPLKVSQLGFLGKQPTPYTHPSNLMLVQNQRLPHQISGCTKLLDGFSSNTSGSPVGSSQQRARFPGAPPPGFTNGPNHMNAFGLGIPRAPSSAGSKILPFMGLGNGADSTINGSSSPVPQVNSISNNLSHVQLLSTQSNQNQVIYPSPGSRGSTPNNLTATSFGVQNCLSTVQSAFKSTTGDCYNVQEWSDHMRPVISNISGNHRNSPSPVAGLQRNTPSPTIHQSSVFGLSTTSGSNIPPKVWNGAGPCSDWTALDPAIMSSSRPHSISNLATNQPPSLAHTHPLILHNTGSQVIQPNISTYLHLQSPHLPGHWLQSLPQDSRVLYNSNSPSVSSSDWNVSSHRSPTHPIAPPPPGFPGHITNHQQMKRINSPQRDMTNS